MPGSDVETIHAILGGDVERYAELVEKYQGPAIRLACSLVGNYDDAREISQEAFVNAYRALGRFRAAATFSTWFYRIVVNECKDAYKRRAHQPAAVVRVGTPGSDEDLPDGLFDVADPGASPSDQVANHELSRQLSSSIGALPMKQRTAFLLHRVHGLPLDEAAAVMGCRVGTVKAHLFRATHTLRLRLASWLAKERS